METERTFNILETYCFPKGCLIPEDQQPYLATVLIPQLEAAGMKTAEWTRGALMLEEPHLTKVKSIVCRGCGRWECQFNPRFKPSGGLGDLMDGQYADRIKKGDELLAQLLPEAKKTELEQQDIKVITLQIPSRKNPKLLFSFTRNDQKRDVVCEVGKRRLWTNEGEETLLSLEQLGQKIKDAINAFV